MFTFAKNSQREQRASVTSAPVTAENEHETEQSDADREAIVRRLRLQGAVQVLPSRFPPSGGREADAASAAGQEAAEPDAVPAAAGPEQLGAGAPGAGSGSGAGVGAGAPDRPYDDVQDTWRWNGCASRSRTRRRPA